MIDEKIKREFMQVKDGYMWNDFAAKYPDLKFNEFDEEMQQHMNAIIRSSAPKKYLENPHTHYESF